MFKRRYAWFATGAFMSVAGLGAYGTLPLRFIEAKPGLPANQDPAASRRVVAAQGRLQPGMGIVRLGTSAPDRIAELLVEEGDWVEKNQLLARLENFAPASSRAKQARQRLENSRKRLAADRAFAQAKVQEALISIEQCRQPARLEIDAQEARIKQIEAQLEQTRRDVDRIASLSLSVAVSVQQTEKQRVLLTQQENDLTSAQCTLHRLKSQQEINLRAAQAAHASARAALAQVESSEDLAILEEAVRLADHELGLTELRAPLAGQVLRIYSRVGESSAQSAVLDMGNTREMYAVAEVYESDVCCVRVGQKARVSSRVFATPLEGTVESVGLAVYRNDVYGDDPMAPADARIIEVRVRLDDSSAASRYTNLQISARIDVDSATLMAAAK